MNLETKGKNIIDFGFYDSEGKYDLKEVLINNLNIIEKRCSHVIPFIKKSIKVNFIVIRENQILVSLLMGSTCELNKKKGQDMTIIGNNRKVSFFGSKHGPDYVGYLNRLSKNIRDIIVDDFDYKYLIWKEHQCKLFKFDINSFCNIGYKLKSIQKYYGNYRKYIHVNRNFIRISSTYRQYDILFYLTVHEYNINKTDALVLRQIDPITNNELYFYIYDKDIIELYAILKAHDAIIKLKIDNNYNYIKNKEYEIKYYQEKIWFVFSNLSIYADIKNEYVEKLIKLKIK